MVVILAVADSFARGVCAPRQTVAPIRYCVSLQCNKRCNILLCEAAHPAPSARSNHGVYIRIPTRAIAREASLPFLPTPSTGTHAVTADNVRRRTRNWPRNSVSTHPLCPVINHTCTMSFRVRPRFPLCHRFPAMICRSKEHPRRCFHRKAFRLAIVTGHKWSSEIAWLAIPLKSTTFRLFSTVARVLNLPRISTSTDHRIQSRPRVFKFYRKSPQPPEAFILLKIRAGWTINLQDPRTMPYPLPLSPGASIQ